jgi:hypothetical protein
MRKDIVRYLLVSPYYFPGILHHEKPDEDRIRVKVR